MKKSNDEDIISVVVPVYNIKDYLPRCINSILAQSYELFELLLIDDGSNDGSSDLCDCYSKIDKRIRVIHQDNAGLSAARNRGIEESKGAYIFFVDGDDFIHPQTFELLYGEEKKNNSNIVVCGLKKVYNDVKEFQPITNYDSIKISKDDIFVKFFENDSHFDLNIACNKLYKKNLFENIRYPVGLLHEDNATTYKLLDLASSITILYVDLYYYFQRYDSIAHKKLDKKRAEDLLEGFNNRIIFFEKKRKFQIESKKQVLDMIIDLMIGDYAIEEDAQGSFICFGKRILQSLNTKDISIKERLYYFFVLYFYRIYFSYKRHKRKILQ